MKKILISIFVLILVVVGGALIFINPILERAKPSLLSSLQGIVGVPIDVKEIEVSILPRPGFVLKEVSTGEGQLKNEIEEASVYVALNSLFKGEIVIDSFSLQGGRLKAIRNKAGKFIFLKGEAKDSDTTHNSKDNSEVVKNDAAHAPEIEKKSSKLPIKITKAEVGNLSFELFDEAKDVTLKIDDVVLNAKENNLDIDIDTKVTAGTDVFKVNARLLESDLNKIKADIDFSVVDINKWVSVFVKEVLPASLEGGLRGTLQYNKDGAISSLSMVRLDLNPLGIKFKEFLDKKVGQSFDIEVEQFPIGAEIDLSALQVKLKGFNLKGDKLLFSPVAKSLNHLGLNVDLNIDELKDSVPMLGQYPLSGKFNVKSGEANALLLDFGGFFNGGGLKIEGVVNKFMGDIDVSPLLVSIGANGKVNVSFKQSTLGVKSIDVKVQDTQIKDLLAFSEGTKSLPLSGILSQTSVKLSGEKAMLGPYDVNVKDFTIVGFNLFTKVLDALEKIPGLKESIVVAIPESYRSVLLGENSSFSTTKVNGTLNGSDVVIASLFAQSKGYHIEGKGGMKAGDLDLDLDFVIEKELVGVLEARSSNITKFKGLDGTILIPLTISKSKDGKPLVYPNIEKLLKSQATAQVREVGKKALDKIKPGLGGLVEGFLGN